MGTPKTLSLLLVEDNPTDRLLIRESLLDCLGVAHVVTEASSLAECLEKIRKTSFDAVLLDLGLPDSEGERSFLKILEASPDISLLVLTGLEDEEAGVSAMRHGAQDYLIKGQCDGHMLARSVRYAVERHSISSELRDLATRLGETSRRLMESEARTREIIEANQDAILVVDEGHIVKFANGSSREILGQSQEDLLNKPFRYSMGMLQSGGFEILRDDGTMRYVEVRLSRVQWNDERAHLVILRDMTVRKQIERKLSLFRTLLDHSSDALEIVDAVSGRVLDMNRTGCERLGYSIEEALQMRLHDFVDVVKDETWEQQRAQVREGRLKTVACKHRSKDGTEIPVEVSLNYVDMTQPYIVAVVRDVTERLSLEEQLRQAQKMEAIGTLAGGIAHDFNNIMGAVRGFTELAIRQNKQENVGTCLQTVLKSSERAVDLIDKILTFSRKQPEARTMLDLTDTVRDSVALLRATIPTTIEINVMIEPNVPTVVANSGQIEQIILNLGTNALHALDDKKGCICIALEAVKVESNWADRRIELGPGDYVRLSVKDTGKGMPPEVADRIFEPFFTTKEPGKGTGLGLAMVHGIIQQHEAVIMVDSVLGQGTTFNCYFPAQSEAPVALDDQTHEEILGDGQRILLVDDEDSLLSLGRETLQYLNYVVDICNCPVEALERATTEDKPYDLILTDQTMPKMTGLELSKAILDKAPGQNIVISTGYSAALTYEVVRKAGIRGVIRKPEGIVRLSRVIHQVLHQKESTPDLFETHTINGG